MRSFGRALRRVASCSLVITWISLLPMEGAGAQHVHHPGDSARRDSVMPAMMEGPLGISLTRMGSGTSWIPDVSPMYASHKMWGSWLGMLHGAAFAQYDAQGSDRGDDQLGIIDWEMVMGIRRVGDGQLQLHGMFSLEPLTIGPSGYPLLLQTGESVNGEPLHDRQHPHDFFMALATMYDRPITRNLGLQVYAGLVGEPALGPVAYMHRPSARNDPFAPLGHHWQDATHITDGVVTGGVYSRWWKLEGSWFNGREPDENLWDIELRSFDASSMRLTVTPGSRWMLSAWYGYLPSSENLTPDDPLHRYGASVLYSGRGWGGGEWATSAIWGANAHPDETENSALIESNLELGPRALASVFGRFEYVLKSAAELVVPGVPPDEQFGIRSLVLGAVREVAFPRGASIGVGARGAVNFIPRSLAPTYGTRTPLGADIFVRIRPTRAGEGGAHH